MSNLHARACNLKSSMLLNSAFVIFLFSWWSYRDLPEDSNSFSYVSDLSEYHFFSQPFLQLWFAHVEQEMPE